MSIKLLVIVALVALIAPALGANFATLGNDIAVAGNNFVVVPQSNQYAQGVIDLETGAGVVLMVPLGALLLDRINEPSPVTGWAWAMYEGNTKVLYSISDQGNFILVIGTTEESIIATAKLVGDI